jgi:hypothetical protein
MQIKGQDLLQVRSRNNSLQRLLCETLRSGRYLEETTLNSFWLIFHFLQHSHTSNNILNKQSFNSNYKVLLSRRWSLFKSVEKAKLSPNGILEIMGQDGNESILFRVCQYPFLIFTPFTGQLGSISTRHQEFFVCN